MPPEDVPVPGDNGHDRPGRGPDPYGDPGRSQLPAPAPLAYSGIDVPLARPVLVDAGDLPLTLAYARRAASHITRRRAMVEALAVLAMAVFGEFLLLPLLAFWRPADFRWFTIIGTGVKGLAAILLCIGLLRLEGRRLGSIGWTSRHGVLNVLIGIGAFVVTFVGMQVFFMLLAMLYPPILDRGDDAAKAIKEVFPDLRASEMIALMIFVGVWEEIAFRGFMLTRLRVALARWWLTIPVGALLFGIGHIYEGPLALAQTTLLGVVMGLLFWWRRSLVPCIVFHVLNNVITFLVLNLR